MDISEHDRAALVELARSCVAAEVGDGEPAPLGELGGVMGQQLGCFVTLTNQGRLRGCIGTFHPDRPLGLMIQEMARSAAHDPRFVYNPITARELPELHVEVSVLSPLEETADPLGLEVGRHGIYIIRGARAGCFLPEVATDMAWTAQEFLDECCLGKAGLPAGAWKLEGTKVFLFTSQKFGG